MISHEVLIIGGGPAGAICADRLLKAGIDVVLIDSSPFPRDKPCAGWITPALLDLLGIEAAEYAQGRILQPLRNFRTGIMFGEMILTSYDENVSYAVRRSEFDNFLVMNSGVTCLPPERISSVEWKNDAWLINGHIKARLAVGAGGHYCPIARVLGGRVGEGPVIIASSSEFEIEKKYISNCTILPDTPSLYFCRDLEGYGWVVRKGDYLNIGLGRLAGIDFSNHLREFCRFLLMKGEVPMNVEGRFRGHAYLSAEGKISRKVAGERALLIGDAAGLADPRTGEGILPAIRSALLAADVIVTAGGDYRYENLLPYAVQLEELCFSPEPLPTLLPASLKKFLGRWILTNEFLTRHYLLDRCFLHRGE